MSKPEEIHLADLLRLLDEVTNPDGEYSLHEISFIAFSRNKADDRGRYRIITNCHKTGLSFNMKANMMRGIRDSITNEIRAVHIRLIIMFDGKKVVW